MVRFGYPVMLDLADVHVLVVGAGPVAARKVAGLAAAGAAVHVVAPNVSVEMNEAVEAGQVAVVESRPYVRADLDGVRLVVTATGDADVDAEVASDAAAAGIFVNAADRPDGCTFVLPAVARNGPLTVAVSTDGASPALAQRLRDHVSTLLTDDVVALAERLRARRREIQTAGGSTEDHVAEFSADIDAVLGAKPPGMRD
jgi:precorrin-2 dehydrogenase/sirohydrochlorin ferrochelatase